MAQSPPPPAVSWTMDEVIDVLVKLPDTDLARFLHPHFPTAPLNELTRPALVELALATLQTYAAETASADACLITATSALCRASFEAFVRLLWEEVPASQPLVWNWHLGVYTSELQQVAEEIIKGNPRPHDLLCNVSPGMSKSTVWSILFPCWMWTRMPSARFITASHTDSLVLDLATKSRDLMKGAMYRLLFPEIEFTEVQDAKSHYRNTHGGERYTCTVGGKSPMGMHAHVVIIDDPIDPQKVLSEAERKTAENFMTRVIPTRRMRGASGDVCVTMLIMQRLGVGDPSDVMLQVAKREGAALLRHLCLPALLTEDVSPVEMRRFYEGLNQDGACAADGLMDPIRLGRRALDEARANLGEWSFAGQFLQKPRPPGGGMFKEKFFFNREAAAPFACRRIRYWDRASSSSESNAATAGTLMAYDGVKIYVEDVVHGRWEPDERNEVMRATALRDRTRYGKYEPIIYVEAEGGSSGRDAWLGVVRALIGFHVKEDVVRGSKDTRAEPWATQLAAGNVVLIDNGESKGFGRASWDINGFVQEHLLFRPTPNSKLGRFKDRVDSASGCMNLLIGLKRVNAPLRTYHLRGKGAKDSRRIIVCTQDDLATLDLDGESTLLVMLDDPPPAPIIGEDKPAAPAQEAASKEARAEACYLRRETDKLAGLSAGIHETGRQPPPPLRSNKHLGTLELRFADLDPKDWQEHWQQPIEPWGLPPGDVQMTRDDGKKIWSALLKKRDEQWQVLILVDKGGEDGRALSAALAICDSLRLPRNSVYRVGSEEEVIEETAPNQHVFDVLKLSRCLVIA